MSDPWKYFKRLFKKAETSSPSQPLIHELIERSAEEKADYSYWKETLVCRRLRDWLAEQYAIFRVAPRDIDEGIDFLNTPSSKGFVIHLSRMRYSQRDVTHFFDFLKEKVRQLDYRSQISDVRSYQRADWVETIERHYLKPPPSFGHHAATGRFDQRFGNIMIELESRNDRVYQLRFRATAYRDHLFEDAEDFKDLFQELVRE